MNVPQARLLPVAQFTVCRVWNKDDEPNGSVRNKGVGRVAAIPPHTCLWTDQSID